MTIGSTSSEAAGGADIAGAPNRRSHAVLTDRELMTRHVEGDADAFGELFRRHRDRLWAVALRTLGNPDDAADALQDAMVSAFRRAASYRGEAAVTTWLHRVVVNACLDRVRREAIRAADPLPEGDHSDRLGAQRDDIALHQRALDVTAALATLPYEQRASLVLVDMEGYTVDETAAMLGVAPGTIKSRCARGRARLLPLVAHLRGEDVSVGPAPRVVSRPGARSGTEPVADVRNPAGAADVAPGSPSGPEGRSHAAEGGGRP
jgi:RNA polymerase sigma-70 factor (ECF subfamily)